MNTATNYAALYLADVSKNQEELEKIATDFPISSAARFLLLYQLKKNNDPRFNEVAKQTGIYLHNPSWMEFQLSDISVENERDVVENLPEPVSTAVEKIIEHDESIQTFEETSSLPIVEINTEEELTETVNEEITGIPVSENHDSFKENDQANENEVAKSLIVNEVEANVIYSNQDDVFQSVNEQINEDPVLDAEKSEEQNVEEEEKKQQDFSDPDEVKVNVVESNEENVIEPVKQISEDPVLENENSVSQVDEDEKEQPNVLDDIDKNLINSDEVESPQAVNEQINENSILESESSDEENNQVEINSKEDDNDTEKEIADNADMIAHEENATDLPKENVLENQEGSEITIEENNLPDNEDEEVVPFEPLHTVDYFASQGIKLSEDVLNNDQLGKQVKSFTAWLKSMKKLHPGQLPQQNEVIEQLIQTSSEESNQSANVLTEAMAEVLVKQGKREKAVEMYQKLSLINPSKSAYFAAKIESLKTT